MSYNSLAEQMMTVSELLKGSGSYVEAVGLFRRNGAQMAELAGMKTGRYYFNGDIYTEPVKLFEAVATLMCRCEASWRISRSNVNDRLNFRVLGDDGSIKEEVSAMKVLTSYKKSLPKKEPPVTVKSAPKTKPASTKKKK